MPASVTSPADVVNLALGVIGYKGRVGSLFDGSEAAKAALDVYAQTRDELLRQNDWGFAERNISMVLLKQAPADGYVPPTVWTPANPPLPWRFEYEYPADCLKVRAIKPQSIFVQTYDPRPVSYELANDNQLVPARKVILCNVADAILTFTGQVTDPATWEPDFVTALADRLGQKLAPALTTLQAAQMSGGNAVISKAVAEREQG